MNKTKVVRITEAHSEQALIFQLCKRLKINGHQFSKLSVENKIEQYLKNSPFKNLVIEVHKNQIFDSMRAHLKITTLQSKSQFPEGYEMGNPLNRWILDPVVKTNKEIQEDAKKLAELVQNEWGKIEHTLKKISVFSEVNILED